MKWHIFSTHHYEQFFLAVIVFTRRLFLEFILHYIFIRYMLFINARKCGYVQSMRSRRHTEAVIGGKIGQCNLSMSKIGKYVTVLLLV